MGHFGVMAEPPYDVVEKSIGELAADLAAGKVTSEQLVEAYVARIEAIDRAGPTLRSVISLNPRALADARHPTPSDAPDATSARCTACRS